MVRQLILLRACPRAALTPLTVLLAFAAAPSCHQPATTPAVIRLVDAFDASLIQGSAAHAAQAPQRTEWRFDGLGGKANAPFAATRGWEAGPGVSGLAVRDGLLVGRTTTDFAILHIERTAGIENADQLHAIEIRLRVSGGANLEMALSPAPTVDIQRQLAVARSNPWVIKTPVMAGDRMQTYTITPPAPISGPRIRHIFIRPTDSAGAEFAIESLRLVFRREHLAGMPSGVSWQGLRGVFRETLVTRSSERVQFQMTLPPRPILHVSIGTPEEHPVTFQVAVRRGDRESAVLTRTVTTPYRWERQRVDLSDFAGATVSLSLSATSNRPGSIAFWGAPAIRPSLSGNADDAAAPQMVILIQGDTLRTDHLDAYGYDRQTAPVLRRLADEGALFQHAITPTSWTKAATPSVLASLYPSTHGVHQIPDRLPSSATTIAEVFRAAGYATVSFASASFTGAFTNLHQGFEELHEAESTAGRAGPSGGTSKTSREYVDRFVEWLEDHRDTPSFIYLHFFDPHSPYEPYPPFDTMWADPGWREEYLREQEVLKKFISSAFLADRGMATRDELLAAGLDPEKFIRFSKDWYDGSIRGMDTELGRLVERLEELGLRERALLAFFADHGEEFHEHGRMWHGQSLYGEMIRVPLIFWGPGRVPKGLKVDEPVSLIDVMPTLLELANLPVPEEAQGQSLRALLAAAGGWTQRPIVAERQPLGPGEHPNASELYAIVEGDWKLIHNVVRPPERPEFELFDFYKDPLDRRDVAAANSEVVHRMARMLEDWRKRATAARLKSDGEETEGMTAEQLERLRSLGYVR